MKELSVEEKAKAYDEALKVLHKYDGVNIVFTQDLKEEMFPELKESKESKDEKLREQVVYAIDQLHVCEYTKDKLKSWLKKQGEHANFRNNIQIGDKVTRNKDGVLVNLSQLNRVAKKQSENNMGISEATKQELKDNLNKALEKETPESWNEFLDEQGEQKPADEIKPKFNVGDYIERKDGLGCHAKIIFVGGNVYGCEKLIYSEDSSPFFEFMFKNQDEFQISSDFKQKPADKVEPKFKVGQTIKKEGFNLGFTIVKIEDGFYYNDIGDYFPFTDQDNWELVEQNPWSEEDEKCIRLSTDIINSALRAGFCVQLDRDRCVDWLNSLKERYTWKPSDEQMLALRWVLNHIPYDSHKEEISGLFEQLKKLRENKL